MGIRIINSDIEIDGEKVARIFDVRPTLKIDSFNLLKMQMGMKRSKKHMKRKG